MPWIAAGYVARYLYFFPVNSLLFRKRPGWVAVLTILAAALNIEVWLRRGDVRKAIEWSQRSVQLLPEDDVNARGVAGSTLGMSCWYLGRLEEAAAFRQAGILRAASIEELFDFTVGFSMQPVPKQGKLLVLTNAGGPGVMAVDAFSNFSASGSMAADCPIATWGSSAIISATTPTIRRLRW